MDGALSFIKHDKLTTMNEKIDILLTRYFSGEATKKELHALDIWLSKSNENEKLFHEMTLLYQHAGQTDELSAVDTEKAWVRFRSYMGEGEKGEGRKEKKSFDVSRIWKVAAAATILLMGTFAVFYFINQPPKTVHLVAVENQKEVIIFENTEVTLFPGAEIIYQNNSKREVQLKGKATFNIDSKTSLGIVVQAGETFIKDIGTIFTVDATAPDISITVKVAEGEVWFFTEINNGVYIKANESAVYEVATQQFKMIKEINIVNEIMDETVVIDEQNINNEPIINNEQPVGARRALPLQPELIQPELIFQNTPLREAIEIIKIRYGIDIIISSNELNEVLLNASFDNHESVEYVLEIITATISARLDKKGKYFIISVD